jgi:predicted porin
MNKLFLTMLFAFSTMIASAQFVGLTTLNEGTDSTWNVTDKIGVGYVVNEKLMVAATMDGEDAYELLGRYDVYNGVWATCIYNHEKDSEAEMKDKMELGVGYSFNVWNKLYVDPYYVMPMKEDAEGNREGEFRLGISYKL